MRSLVHVGLVAAIMLAGVAGRGTGQEKDEKPVRIASEVSGHIHPAVCVTKSGAILVIFSKSDYKDLRLSRSIDGGRTWSEPVPVSPTEKLSIDVDPKQPGGPGVFFLRTPLPKLQPRGNPKGGLR